MALDTTTGAASAESYCSVTQASAYHTARGNTAWAALATDAIREQCLRKATDYLEQVYSQAWQGLRVNNIQALSWPRSGVVVNYYSIAIDVIPTQIINATAEMALKAASGELMADLEHGVLSEKVDVLEVTYDKYSPRHKVYSTVASMLKPLLRNTSSMNAALVRA